MQKSQKNKINEELTMKKYRIVLLYPYGRIEITEFAESKEKALAQIEARLIFCLDEYAVVIFEPK